MRKETLKQIEKHLAQVQALVSGGHVIKRVGYYFDEYDADGWIEMDGDEVEDAALLHAIRLCEEAQLIVWQEARDNPSYSHRDRLVLNGKEMTL